MQETFGERLQAARKALPGRVSQESLGAAVGKSGRSIRNYEAGKSQPDVETLRQLRKVLGAFDAMGDPVEIAIDSSELIEWRRDAVKSFYKRNLHEQREERGA